MTKRKLEERRKKSKKKRKANFGTPTLLLEATLNILFRLRSVFRARPPVGIQGIKYLHRLDNLIHDQVIYASGTFIVTRCRGGTCIFNFAWI